MPTSVLPDDDEQIIADLQRDVRRLRSRLATTSPRGGHDAWTAAATPATTYQLSTIPVQGTCEFAINGHEQREGTDFTVDADTGVVSVLASLVSGDLLVARYLVTDWLVARSLPEDTGPVTFGTPGWTILGGAWTFASGKAEQTSNIGGVLYGSAWYVIYHDIASVAQDITVTSRANAAATVQLQAIMFAWDPTVSSTTYSAYQVWIKPDNSTAIVKVYRTRDDGVTTQIGTDLTSTPYVTSEFRVTYDPTTGAIDVYQDGTHLGTRTDGTPLTGAGHTRAGFAQLNAAVDQDFYNLTAQPL